VSNLPGRVSFRDLPTRPQADLMRDLVEEFWDLRLVETLHQQGLRKSPDDFRDALHQLLGRRGRLLLTGSARQALRIVLTRAAAGSPRRRVLLAAFNCRVVREAARRAGLAVDTFDFATPNGRIEWEAVASRLTGEHLAIVVPHFFGIPTDFTALLAGARRNGVMIVEDCAHALGASISGTTAGLLGDAAVFSFNYDKPISLAGGGALLLHHPAIDIDRGALEAPPPDRVELRQFRQMAAMLRYNRTRRERRPLAARVGARLHVPPYAPPRLPTGVGSLRATVGIWQLERYDEVRDHRNRNAQILHDSLRRIYWDVGSTVKPAHLKLRVVVSQADGALAVQQCRQHGITIANSNWARLIEPDDPASEPLNATRAAAFGLEVPVHQNLSRTDLQVIASAFMNAQAPDGEPLP
jgi:dTDP-4-amino-4,6-dideoxygalactose transaminase